MHPRSTVPLTLLLSLVVLLVPSAARAASQPFCCSSTGAAAGQMCVPTTSACTIGGTNTDEFAWVATVWAAQTPRIDLLPAGPDNFGLALWWMNGPNFVTNMVHQQNIHLEATGQDTTHPVSFCFQTANVYSNPPVTGTVHEQYTTESGLNYTTAAGQSCVNATVDARFVTPVPALPRAGLAGLGATLAVAGCFFGVRSLRRREVAS